MYTFSLTSFHLTNEGTWLFSEHPSSLTSLPLSISYKMKLWGFQFSCRFYLHFISFSTSHFTHAHCPLHIRTTARVKFSLRSRRWMTALASSSLCVLWTPSMDSVRRSLGRYQLAPPREWWLCQWRIINIYLSAWLINIGLQGTDREFQSLPEKVKKILVNSCIREVDSIGVKEKTLYSNATRGGKACSKQDKKESWHENIRI